LGAAFSVRRQRRKQGLQLLLRDAGGLPMFADIIAGNAIMPQSRRGRGSDWESGDSATSNVS
jgi:hypothetical protein